MVDEKKKRKLRKRLWNDDLTRTLALTESFTQPFKFQVVLFRVLRRTLGMEPLNHIQIS